MQTVELTPSQEDTVRRAVASRLGGDDIDEAGAGLRLSAARTEAVPELTLFRAEYGKPEMSGVLAGTVEKDRINTYPNDALVGVWERWLDRGGLPDADEVLAVTLFMIGGDENVVVESGSARVLDADAGEGVGVAFTWSRHIGRFNATYRLTDDELIELSETKA